MARFRRTRKYTRANRAKWSSNIQEINTETYNAPPGISGDSITLVSNPIQTPTFTSQIYTVKNVECSFTFSSSFGQNSVALEDLAVYIMFVPQGMNLTNDYNMQHPEYIMAYKYIGSPTSEATFSGYGSSQNYQPIKIKTRLARKLNSGDQIVLFWKVNNTATGPDPATLPYELGGLIRWWTKAN